MEQTKLRDARRDRLGLVALRFFSIPAVAQIPLWGEYPITQRGFRADYDVVKERKTFSNVSRSLAIFSGI
jgi:hypothetical protein